MSEYKNKFFFLNGGLHYANYMEENLVKAVEKGLKKQVITLHLSKKYNIPKSTIDNKSNGKHSFNFGGQCILPEEEELMLTQNIILTSTWKFSLIIKGIWATLYVAMLK